MLLSTILHLTAGGWKKKRKETERMFHLLALEVVEEEEVDVVQVKLWLLAMRSGLFHGILGT